MNAILLIKPYWHNGTWCFDDEPRGLLAEPFVSGAPEIITEMVKDIPAANNGFKLLFSEEPFPNYQIKLNWIRQEYDGNWYKDSVSGKEGWLCPALFKYFSNAPKTIYTKAEGLKD
jgi:hypothetical protein